VPTIDAKGVKGFILLFDGTAETPSDIQVKLNHAIVAATKARLWGDVIRAANISVE